MGSFSVPLDIIVRDKKGHAVRDLKASDFEVFEDGVKQKIESFEVYGRPPADAVRVEAKGTPAAPAPTAPAAPAAAVPEAPEPDVRPQVIAFVFDRLSADARDTAHKAALTYLDKGHVDGDLVGVFTIDLALRTLQPFTNETFLIRTALDKAASQGNTAFADNAAGAAQPHRDRRSVRASERFGGSGGGARLLRRGPSAVPRAPRP